MKLYEEITQIFNENSHRLSLVVLMELANDIIYSCVSLVAKSDDEFKQLTEKLTNQINLQLKTNLEAKQRKIDANKS